MALKAAVEEFVDWIVELRASSDEVDDPDDLDKAEWKAVGERLKTAARNYDGAAKVLRQAQLGSRAAVAIELAHSLHLEAEDLMRRARMLAQRTSEAKGPADLPAAVEEEMSADLRDVGKEDFDAEGAALERGAGEAQASNDASIERHQQRAAPSVATRVEIKLRLAQYSVETARTKVTTCSGPAAKAFETELDVMAEMTLALRRRTAEQTEAVLHG